MAKLPEIPNDTAVTPQVRSSVSGADVARASPFAVAADALAGIGKHIEVSAEHYQQGVEVANTARELDLARTDALKLMQEANGNVDVFQKAWEARTAARLPTVPEAYRAKVEADFTDIGGSTARGIITQQQTRDSMVAKDRIDARQSTLLTQMTDLASAGQTGTDAYRGAHEEYVSLTQEKVTNPFFAYSKERADLDLSSAEDTLIGASVSGELGRIYQKDGYAAAQKRAQEIYADDSSGLDKVKKLKAISAGLKSVSALYATDTQARRQFSADRQEVVAKLADGTLPPDDPIVADMMATADMLNDPLSRLSLVSAQGKARLNPLGSMGLHDRLGFIDGMAGVPPDAAGLIRAEEGFKPSAYFDVNAYRTGYGSDTITRADGTIEKVTKDTVVTRDDAERDLNRRIGEFVGVAAGQVGQDAWNALPDGARSGLASLAYNYGKLPSSVAAAAKTGDVNAIADAVRKLPDNPDRRQREAAVIAGVASPTAGYVKGVLPEVRKSIAGALTDALAQADESLKHDQPVDAGAMKDMIEAARIVDDAGQYDKVQAIFARSATVAAMAGVAVPDQATLIDSMRAPGPVGDEALRLAALDQAEATNKRMSQLLTDDPRALGIQLGLFKTGPALDFTNLDQAPAILASRVPEMERLAVAEKSGPLSVLRPDEAAALGKAWEGADANRRTAILGALTKALPADTLRATLARFAGDKNTEPMAIAGALTSVSPEAGAAVVRGLDALKTNPKFGFSEDNAGDLSTRNGYFPVTTMVPAMQGAWQAHLDAARAVYADASARAGDATGAFNADRWKAAVDKVTGGFVSFNGEKIIAPAPGIDQRRFDEVIASLPRQAFGGATSLSGTPVTADTVRRLGRLQSTGDGRYAVMIGDAYALEGPRSGRGGPARGGRGDWRMFELDLRPYLDPDRHPILSLSPQESGAVDAATRLAKGRGGFFGLQ